jgi:hypothetical protein
MTGRGSSLARATVLLMAAFLLMVSEALAGPSARAGDQPAAQRRPAAVSVVRTVSVPVSITVVAPTQARPAVEPLSVNLRGPDGQVRRFAVEGGRDAIQVRQVVLRPGTSVTIQWTAAK